jgi:sulfonate transport system substrate-binding protein
MYQPAAGRPSPGRMAMIAACCVGLAALLVASPVYATARAANGKPDLSGVTLRVGIAIVRDTSTQDIRIASGAFDHTPYQIKWATFPTGTGALEALNAGAIDMAIDLQAPSSIFAQAGAKEPWTRATAPFKIVGAALPPPAGGPVIGVRADAGIRKVADLKGKKVAYSKGTTSHLYWLVAARKAKLEKGDVETVELPVAEARAAFLSGAVDAVVSGNRTFQPMVRDGQAEVIARSNGVVPEYRVTTARTAFLGDRKQAVAVGDLLERLARSKRWLTRHKAEGAAIYQRVANVDPADAKAAVNEIPVDVIAVDNALASGLQVQAKLFFQAGATPTIPKVAIIFDRRYNAGLSTAK